MSVTFDFRAPFYSGTTAATSEVPYPYPVALAGRAFLVDTLHEQFGQQSIPFLRNTQDQSAEPGEQSLSPMGLWRRFQESWHGGAGQDYLDREDSLRYRFRSSRGVNPWEKWELSLLNATASRGPGGGATFAVVAGSRLYVAHGTAVSFTTDITVGSPTWTSVTGLAGTVQSMASDGFTVYIQTTAADGVYVTNSGISTASAFVTGSLISGPIGVVKGRLLVAHNQDLHNIMVSGALPGTPNVLDNPNAGFRWVGFAAGTGHIYAAGYSGDKCVDDQTEVLTKRGWLRHDELMLTDEALAVDPQTNVIRWDRVEAVNRYDWNGPLERWQTPRFDALTTPNHRWMTAYRGKHHGRVVHDGPFPFLTTEELRDRPYVKLKVGGGHPEEFATTPVYSDEFVELIGWVVTEGTYPPGETAVKISQSFTHNPLYCDRLAALVKAFAATGATATVCKTDSRGQVVYYFGRGIGPLVRQAAPNRQLMPDFLTSLTRSQAELLFQTLIDGDGHRSPKGSTSWMQKDQGRIDSFQMLAAMLGKRTHQHTPNDGGCSLVSVYKAPYSANWTLKKTQEHYEGVVWCPTTASGTWLARRNGFTFWTGNSLIYRTAVLNDGTALGAAVVAGELPDGEIVRSIYGYLGFILIGSDLGVRFAQPNGNGDLTIGNLIETDSPVRCFEGQDRFVWFGWENFESTTSGLGRLDLRTFPEELTPSYASDLQSGTGAVNSVVTFQERRAFTVGGALQVELPGDTVSVGRIDSGFITFGLPEQKTAMYVDVRTDTSLGGLIYTWLAVDGGTFTQLGWHGVGGQLASDPYPAGEREGERFEIRHTFSTSVSTHDPILRRHTLKALPRGNTAGFIFLPLQINATDQLDSGVVKDRDPAGDLEFIRSLRASQTPVQVQEGLVSYSATVDDYRFHARGYAADRDGAPIGTCLVTLKEVAA